MNDTYIIFDDAFYQRSKTISEKLGFKTISYQAHEKESKTHEWLTREFEDKNIRKLVIPLSLQSNETEGLLIALHIRLNYELSLEQRIIPIILITNLSLENIITKCSFDGDNNPQNLLLTQGISLSSTDIEEIQEKIDQTEPLCKEEYPLFLKKLSINRKTTSGHHDMANAWGCYKLSRVVGYDLKSPVVKEYLGQLYSKWLICINNAFENKDKLFNDNYHIKCERKHILYIDDKADEGWGELMQYIFRDAGEGFVYVNPSKYKINGFDYNSFHKECESHIGKKWDLILVDLRLNPDVEDIDGADISPESLSGYSLIDDFLNDNAGYRIIVFTASNKIWNIDAALRRGACGYYIKESPDFTKSEEESGQMYLKSIKEKAEDCFKKSYLFEIDKKITEIWNTIPQNNKMGEEIYSQLDVAFELIRTADRKDKYALAFVSLEMVVEILVKYLVKREKDTWLWLLPNGEPLHNFYYDERLKRCQDSRCEYKDKTDPKRAVSMAGLLYQEWKIANYPSIATHIWQFIHKRNAYIHKDKKELKANQDIFNASSFVGLFDCLYPILRRKEVYLS